MKKSSIKTSRNQAHTSKSPKGMGDFYGTGIRQKIGRLRDSIGVQQIKPSKLKKAPKSLA